MFVILFLLLIVSGLQKPYLQLKVSNSPDCLEIENEIVEYLISIDSCIVALSNSDLNREVFSIINGLNVTHTIYEGLEERCELGNFLSVEEYPLNSCFSNFSNDVIPPDSGLYYYFNVTDIFGYDHFNDSISDEWTTLEYFTDDECSATPTFVEWSESQSYRRGNHFSSIHNSRKYVYCTGEEYTLTIVSSTNFSEFYFLATMRNLPDNECSDRMNYFFQKPKPYITSFIKKCRSNEEFFDNVATEMDCPGYQIDQVYYTDDCEGHVFTSAVTPLRVCDNMGFRKYNNNTHQIFVSYEDLDCGGEIIAVESGHTHGESCVPFEDTGYENSEDWGYKIELADDPGYPSLLAMIVIPHCGFYTEAEIEEIKRERNHVIYYSAEDTCIRSEDWGGLITISNSKSFRGECVDGEMVAKNFTIRTTCENMFSPVTDDFCEDTPLSDYSLYFTCIPFYCSGVEEYDPNVCSGHGSCIGNDVCDCDSYYDGENCEISIDSDGSDEDNDDDDRSLAGIVIGTIIGTTSLLCSLFLVSTTCLILFACYLFLSFIIGGWVVALSLVFVIYQLFESQKKFRKLKNFDILLREQILDEDESLAHLRIKDELFKVPFSEIRLVRTVGEGGSNSVVYEARWRNQSIAFKSFRTRELCGTQSSFDEFEREVEILGSVNHPHILRFLGCSLKPPRVGILMEFCEKGDLKRFLMDYKSQSPSKTSYPVPEKMRLLNEIILAMDYLHSRQIIHRDLKLENVLVDNGFSARVMDFGLSRIFDEKVHTQQHKTSKIGTSVYMAPEIVTSSFYSSSVDIFSMAIVMYIVFTEKFNPYGSGGTQYIEVKVSNNPNFRPNLSDLDQSLSSSPEQKEILGWIKPIIISSWDHDAGYRPSFSELSELFRKNFVERKIQDDDKDNKIISVYEIMKSSKSRLDRNIKKDEEVGEEDENEMKKKLENLEGKKKEYEKIIQKLRDEVQTLKKKKKGEEDDNFDEF